MARGWDCLEVLSIMTLCPQDEISSTFSISHLNLFSLIPKHSSRNSEEPSYAFSLDKDNGDDSGSIETCPGGMKFFASLI